ncbi:hypothetical protein Poly24_17580 [Rosistilla carotiformis]|uniref:Uncharacterized protein n=1 Tax=Rosistilla carotiformis TaxID=2528017 RepID=A0A518JR85_9BACT|nr:hypothetical protein Poly24_17580 [Rosistilla carotiformis]
MLMGKRQSKASCRASKIIDSCFIMVMMMVTIVVMRMPTTEMHMRTICMVARFTYPAARMRMRQRLPQHKQWYQQEGKNAS